MNNKNPLTPAIKALAKEHGYKITWQNPFREAEKAIVISWEGGHLFWKMDPESPEGRRVYRIGIIGKFEFGGIHSVSNLAQLKLLIMSDALKDYGTGCTKKCEFKDKNYDPKAIKKAKPKSDTQAALIDGDPDLNAEVVKSLGLDYGYYIRYEDQLPIGKMIIVSCNAGEITWMWQPSRGGVRYQLLTDWSKGTLPPNLCTKQDVIDMFDSGVIEKYDESKKADKAEKAQPTIKDEPPYTLKMSTKKRKRAPHELSKKWIKRALDIFGIEIKVTSKGSWVEINFICVEESNNTIATYHSDSSGADITGPRDSRWKFPKKFKNAKAINHFIIRGGLRQLPAKSEYDLLKETRPITSEMEAVAKDNGYAISWNPVVGTKPGKVITIHCIHEGRSTHSIYWHLRSVGVYVGETYALGEEFRQRFQILNYLKTETCVFHVLNSSELKSAFQCMYLDAQPKKTVDKEPPTFQEQVISLLEDIRDGNSNPGTP